MSRVRILASLYPKGPRIRCGSPPLSPQEIHVLPETLARPSAVICHQRLGFPGLGLMPAPGAARCHFPTLRRAASPPRSLQGPRPTCSWTRPTPGQAQGQCSRAIAVFFLAFLGDVCAWRGRQSIASWNKSAFDHAN